MVTCQWSCYFADFIADCKIDGCVGGGRRGAVTAIHHEDSMCTPAAGFLSSIKKDCHAAYQIN